MRSEALAGVRRDRAIVLFALGGIAVSTWVLLAGAHAARSSHFGPSAVPFAPTPLALAAVMWMGMMVAMMLPVVTPWVLVLSTMGSGERSLRRIAEFVMGYFAVWAAYAMAGAAAQVGTQSAGWLHGEGSHLTPVVGGLVLVGAGAFQFSGLKDACLAHCRSPLAFFLARWRDGPVAGWSLGLRHGIYCLGCCWALMAVVFALGVMNLLWMAAIAAIVCVEQLLPGGRRVARGVGVAMCGWGGWLVVPGW